MVAQFQMIFRVVIVFASSLNQFQAVVKEPLARHVVKFSLVEVLAVREMSVSVRTLWTARWR